MHSLQRGAFFIYEIYLSVPKQKDFVKEFLLDKINMYVISLQQNTTYCAISTYIFTTKRGLNYEMSFLR